MADELEKKPKPIGTPAPNYPKPKQESASAPAPKLDRQKSASFGKVKVKPGSPNMPESVPVGVQQTKFESPKHVEKRVNKMFKDTNQPTLGVWNKNNKNPMAEPNGIRFNPKLDYKPSKEALEAANRKKIMQTGFAPKGLNIDRKYDINLLPDEEGYDMKQDYLNTPEHSEFDIQNLQNSNKDEYDFEDINISDGEEVKRRWLNTRNALRNDYISKGFSPEEADYVLDNYLGEEKVMTSPDFINSTLKYNEGQRNGQKNYTNDDIPDIEEDMPESDERSKASELYGTDLNKQQGYDYDRLSKELDSGDMVNLDGGLLPYEYGFETNGYEDLAVDARKNPETGKYEVFMYPETEDGPVEEPDENYPDYEFDSFDDLKAFMENNYKKVEKPKWDPMNEPGSGGVTKELMDFVREQLKADGGLNDNFIDAYLSKMPQNSNQADYWKGKYQEAWNKKYGGNK